MPAIGVPAIAGPRHAVAPRRERIGHIVRGMPNSSSSSVVPSSVSRFISRVRLALVTSVTCIPPRAAGEVPETQRAGVPKGVAALGPLPRATMIRGASATFGPRSRSPRGRPAASRRRKNPSSLDARRRWNVVGDARILPDQSVGQRNAGALGPTRASFPVGW